jgi:anti-anti-sigma factor
MQPNEGPVPGHEASQAPIKAELQTGGGSRFAAIVMLRGEHDIATAPGVELAIGSISGNVLVDLSECAFLDSSILGVLIGTSKKLERDGRYLEIVAPSENSMITRTLEVVGMRHLVVVHPSGPSLDLPPTSSMIV